MACLCFRQQPGCEWCQRWLARTVKFREGRNKMWELFTPDGRVLSTHATRQQAEQAVQRLSASAAAGVAISPVAQGLSKFAEATHKAEAHKPALRKFAEKHRASFARMGLSVDATVTRFADLVGKGVSLDSLGIDDDQEDEPEQYDDVQRGRLIAQLQQLGMDTSALPDDLPLPALNEIVRVCSSINDTADQASASASKAEAGQVAQGYCERFSELSKGGLGLKDYLAAYYHGKRLGLYKTPADLLPRKGKAAAAPAKFNESQLGEQQKVQRFAETPSMKHALHCNGETPADYVNRFAKIQQTRPGYTAAMYGVTA